MSRSILVTGATGKQGGSVVNAILARYSSEFTILAVTRDASSPQALRLSRKSHTVKLVEGDLNQVPKLFSVAEKVAGGPIWGVYSVQAAVTKGTTTEGEIIQGKALVDQAIARGVKHFVYSSVDRGGNVRSWDNPTAIPHFQAKHQIEHHLRNAVLQQKQQQRQPMGWTILRPVIFFDNMSPHFTSKVFMTSLRDTMKKKPLQWIATSDIGVFAAEAFHNPEKYDKRAIGLAGEKLTFQELSARFQKVTGKRTGTTFGLLGYALKSGVKEVGLMLDWFKDDGYDVDIGLAKSIHPAIKDTETWLRVESPFKK